MLLRRMLALAVIGFGEDKSGHIIGDVCFQELEGILLRVNGVAVLDVPEGDAVVDVEFGVVQVCSDRADMHGIGIDGFELYLLIAPAPQRDEVFHESVCLHEQEDDGYEQDIVCDEDEEAHTGDADTDGEQDERQEYAGNRDDGYRHIPDMGREHVLVFVVLWRHRVSTFLGLKIIFQ